MLWTRTRRLPSGGQQRKTAVPLLRVWQNTATQGNLIHLPEMREKDGAEARRGDGLVKFAVTAVPISRRTRRRAGKARTEIVDNHNAPFVGINEPHVVELTYESFWNQLDPTSQEIVKVVDVRIVEN